MDIKLVYLLLLDITRLILIVVIFMFSLFNDIIINRVICVIYFFISLVVRLLDLNKVIHVDKNSITTFVFLLFLYYDRYINKLVNNRELEL
jgi:hypothetical protein